MKYKVHFEFRSYHSRMSELKRPLRVQEVADYLDISKTKAYHMVKAAELSCLRMNESVRVPCDAFMEWVRRNTTGGVDTSS